MKLKIYFICLVSVVLLVVAGVIYFPNVANAVAIVKGEMPKVEPLQSLPSSTKPNYDHSVQSGQFESQPVSTSEEAIAAEPEIVPAAIIKSSDHTALWVVLIFLGILAGLGYLVWSRRKSKV